MYACRMREPARDPDAEIRRTRPTRDVETNRAGNNKTESNAHLGSETVRRERRVVCRPERAATRFAEIVDM